MSYSIQIYKYISLFLLQIYDASINDWRVLDEKTRTDVIEKIVEAPKKTVYIDEYVEIEKNSKILEENENSEYNLNKISKRKDITENIYDETDETLKIVNKNKKTIDSRKVSFKTIIFVIQSLMLL